MVSIRRMGQAGERNITIVLWFRSGEATMLAPFEYGAIFYTVLPGWLIWGEMPGMWEATGILFLIAAGLLTWWRESLHRPPQFPTSEVTSPAPATPRRLAFVAPLRSRRAPSRKPG